MNNSPAPGNAATDAGVATLSDVMLDLEAGRSLPLGADRLRDLTSLRRPAMGGAAFLRTYVTARLAGRVHPRLARRALERLWFTPWVHPAALRPLTAVPDGLVRWSLPAGDVVLQGYAAGAGPTVVLVHGWASRAADLRHVAAELVAAGWRVVAPDLPAHGRTAGERTDLFELAGALGAVLHHEQPEAVVVHSMGFPVLMLAAEAGAPVPHRIVALAPGRRMAHALDAFVARARLSPRLATELRRAVEVRFGAGIWDHFDVDRVLPDLDATGVVVHDADDDEVPVADARAIAAAWRGAELVVTRGLGHRRVLREPAVLAEVVRTLG